MKNSIFVQLLILVVKKERNIKREREKKTKLEERVRHAQLLIDVALTVY